MKKESKGVSSPKTEGWRGMKVGKCKVCGKIASDNMCVEHTKSEPVSPAVRLKEIAEEQESIVSKTGFAEIKRMNELGHEIIGIQSSLSWFACRLEKMKDIQPYFHDKRDVKLMNIMIDELLRECENGT